MQGSVSESTPPISIVGDEMGISSTSGLSVVIVSWNTAALLRGCLTSLLTSPTGGSIEVIVVDNDSSDGSANLVQRDFPGVQLVRNRSNTGFASANNQGIVASRGLYVLLLNSDALLPPGAATSLVEFMEQYPGVGASGPRLVRPDGRPQEFSFGGDPTLGYLLRRALSSLLWRRPLHDWNTDQVQEVDWVSGACLLARREAIDQVGLLDENYFMYFEDNDWCLRMRGGGWKVYYNPRVSVTHVGGQSLIQNPAAQRAYYRSLDYFYAKHYGPLARVLLRVSLVPYRLLVRG